MVSFDDRICYQESTRESTGVRTWISDAEWAKIKDDLRAYASRCSDSHCQIWITLFHDCILRRGSSIKPALSAYDSFRGVEDHVAPTIAFQRRLARKLFINRICEYQRNHSASELALHSQKLTTAARRLAYRMGYLDAQAALDAQGCSSTTRCSSPMMSPRPTKMQRISESVPSPLMVMEN